MSSESTRRDFLRISAAGLAAGAVTEATPAWVSLDPASPGGSEITVRVTDKKRRFESASALTWRQAAKPSADTITLNPEKKFQEILGFGAAFTDASCYLFSQLSADSRET